MAYMILSIPMDTVDKIAKDIEIEDAGMADISDAKESISGIYEVGFQIIPTVTSAEAQDIFSKIRDIVEANGTEIIASNNPESISLAYEMRKKIGGKFQKYNDAYFAWIKYASSSDKVTKIRSEIEKIEAVLRFIIITTVRENTLISQKSAIIRKPESESHEPKMEVTPEAMDEEINKTLEGLEIK